MVFADLFTFLHDSLIFWPVFMCNIAWDVDHAILLLFAYLPRSFFNQFLSIIWLGHITPSWMPKHRFGSFDLSPLKYPNWYQTWGKMRKRAQMVFFQKNISISGTLLTFFYFWRLSHKTLHAWLQRIKSNS